MSVPCRATSGTGTCSLDGTCVDDAMQSLEATFDVSSEGALRAKSLLLHVTSSAGGKGDSSAAGKAARTVQDVVASCPQLAGLGKAAGASGASKQQQLTAAVEGLEHMFELLANQAQQR